MKKILLRPILFFLIFAVLISFTGCNDEPSSNDQPSPEEGFYKTFEEYNKWLSSNLPLLGTTFPTYQKIALLGEFAGFLSDLRYDNQLLHNPVGYTFNYTLTDKSMQNFDFCFAGKGVVRFGCFSDYKIFSDAKTPEDVEPISGIQHVKIPTTSAHPQPYISYSSIQFEYEYTETDIECMLKTIKWKCSGLIFMLSIEDYPLNTTDTFLGQMLTSFEAAEAGIKALNLAMFEFSDES